MDRWEHTKRWLIVNAVVLAMLAPPLIVKWVG